MNGYRSWEAGGREGVGRRTGRTSGGRRRRGEGRAKEELRKSEVRAKEGRRESEGRANGWGSVGDGVGMEMGAECG